MGEFVTLIQAIKNDKEKFEELLIKMEPLINKYVRLLYKEEKEDVYAELVLALWESVLKISYFENDGQIINFICRALKNRYYELYRNSKKRCEHEINSRDDIYFVKESSKDLTDDLIISEDLYNYEPRENSLILQDSYFALRSYAFMKQKYPNTLAREVYKLLQLFPKPEFTFYLTTSIEERRRRNKIRDKPMSYMEKLLISNPKDFEAIEKNLRDITTSLFDAEVISTEGKKPNEIALYIGSRIRERNRNRGDDVYERE